MSTITKPKRIDLNRDGIPDVITGASIAPPLKDKSGKTIGHADGFSAEVSLRTKAGKLIKFDPAPKGIGLYAYEMAAVAFTHRDPKIRFYHDDGLVSFSQNQRVGITDADGDVNLTMTIHGFVMGLQMRQKGIDLEPQYTPLTKGGHMRVYQQDAKGNVLMVHGFTWLTWVIWDDKHPERLNPHWILDTTSGKKTPGPLTPGEELLKPLFVTAQTFARKHPTQKGTTPRNAAAQLTKSMARWRAASLKTDPTRTKAITDPALWEGVKMALWKTMGFSPADFPG